MQNRSINQQNTQPAPQANKPAEHTQPPAQNSGAQAGLVLPPTQQTKPAAQQSFAQKNGPVGGQGLTLPPAQQTLAQNKPPVRAATNQQQQQQQHNPEHEDEEMSHEDSQQATKAPVEVVLGCGGIPAYGPIPNTAQIWNADKINNLVTKITYIAKKVLDDVEYRIGIEGIDHKRCGQDDGAVSKDKRSYYICFDCVSNEQKRKAFRKIIQQKPAKRKPLI